MKGLKFVIPLFFFIIFLNLYFKRTPRHIYKERIYIMIDSYSEILKFKTTFNKLLQDIFNEIIGYGSKDKVERLLKDLQKFSLEVYGVTIDKNNNKISVDIIKIPSKEKYEVIKKKLGNYIDSVTLTSTSRYIEYLDNLNVDGIYKNTIIFFTNGDLTQKGGWKDVFYVYQSLRSSNTFVCPVILPSYEKNDQRKEAVRGALSAAAFNKTVVESIEKKKSREEKIKIAILNKVYKYIKPISEKYFKRKVEKKAEVYEPVLLTEDANFYFKPKKEYRTIVSSISVKLQGIKNIKELESETFNKLIKEGIPDKSNSEKCWDKNINEDKISIAKKRILDIILMDFKEYTDLFSVDWKLIFLSFFFLMSGVLPRANSVYGIRRKGIICNFIVILSLAIPLLIFFWLLKGKLSFINLNFLAITTFFALILIFIWCLNIIRTVNYVSKSLFDKKLISFKFVLYELVKISPVILLFEVMLFFIAEPIFYGNNLFYIISEKLTDINVRVITNAVAILLGGGLLYLRFTASEKAEYITQIMV